MHIFKHILKFNKLKTDQSIASVCYILYTLQGEGHKLMQKNTNSVFVFQDSSIPGD